MNNSIKGFALTAIATLTVCTANAQNVLWQAEFHKNYSSTSVTDSGISNMDRYSFSGAIQNNQTEEKKDQPTSILVKNGFGKSPSQSVNGMDCIEFATTGPSGVWSGNISQNNDWLVSSEIDIPADSKAPAVKFGIMNIYGTNNQNILEVYVTEINDQNVYTQGEQNQDDKGMTATPSNLPWTILASTYPKAPVKNKIDLNLLTASKELNTTQPALRSVDLSAYKGKKIRIALRVWNPSENSNNTRLYRIEGLRVEAAQ